MVKRVWTNEDKQDIVKSFQEGKTFKELQDKYNAHYFTIKKVLDEFNIDTNSKRRWTSKQKQDILRMYTEESMSIAEIKTVYTTHSREISKILRDFGIDTSYYQSRRVNRNINKDFFEVIDTEEKAYILGLLMADGCVRYRREGQCYLTLELIDKEIVERVQKELNSDSKIYESHRKRDYIKNEKSTYTFSVTDKKLCNDLAKYGIIPMKTKKTDWLTQDIPYDLRKHYLRGLFDGDGSIGYYNNRWFITLINNHPEFLKDVGTWIDDLIGLKCPKVSKTSTSYRVGYTGKKAKKLIKLLYQNNNIHIDRKQKLADQAIQDIV
nr:intron-encoded putative endonuclease [Staphylococcus phage 812]ABL87137.1 intron-encoded putative endonuclease [Staphylococcus phage 812]